MEEWEEKKNLEERGDGWVQGVKNTEWGGRGRACGGGGLVWEWSGHGGKGGEENVGKFNIN
ncbi:unnamed protein product [Prunus armeniaca]